MSHCTDQQVSLDFVLLYNGLQQIFVLQKLRNKQTNKQTNNDIGETDVLSENPLRKYLFDRHLDLHSLNMCFKQEISKFVSSSNAPF